ncbi:MAG: DUF4258 domain-containing protein [Yersiniaceae bacterium]|nr:DUF4258 domain-containing protein [Yersiniaceae bacterium]
MFRLLRAWDAERELSPDDFQYILTPTEAFRLARIFYDLNSDNYRYPRFSCHDLPRRKTGYIYSSSAPDQRRRFDYVDDVYDYTEMNLDQGWIIGIETSEQWDYYRNPFYFDEDCNLRYDCFMDHYHSWFEMEVRKAYEKCLNNHDGRKPAPTIKQHYADAPVQHAQSTKAVNTKNAGRLLAAGGVYNGNIEGFRQAAEQLGGDVLAGYDEILNDQTKGTAIAAVSVAVGLGIGRLGAAGKVNTLSQLPGVDMGSYYPTGRIGNPMNALGANAPTIIGKLHYSAHAIDRMQGRGVPPTAVENAIRTGDVYPTKTGTTGYYDSMNNLRVIVNSNTGNIVTIIPGAPK